MQLLGSGREAVQISKNPTSSFSSQQTCLELWSSATRSDGVLFVIFLTLNTDTQLKSRDSSRTQLHLHASWHSDLLEDFTRTPLLPDEIFLAPQHQPVNPEDEDDVVPDQHAAFGIKQATQRTKEPAWKDLRLEELLKDGPSEGSNIGELLRARKRVTTNGNGAGSGGVNVGGNLRS